MVFVWQKDDIEVAESNDGELPEDDDDQDLPVGKRSPETQKSTNRSKGAKKSKNGKRKASTPSSEKNRKKAKPTPVENSKNVVLVIGIDYGTTYSGVSYNWNTAEVGESVVTINRWPGDGEHLVKMPSVIAYASENQEWGPDRRTLERDVIGYEVEPGMVSCAWCKLLLDESAPPTDYDDPYLYSAVGKGAFRLPKGKTAVDVAADFLRLLRQTVMKRLAEFVLPEVLNTTSFEFWATVPAVWNDSAQYNTQAAFEKAGYFDREIDKVNFISEPEAAAVAALKRSARKDVPFITKDMTLVIADIGGGTIDIEAMRIEKLDPLKLTLIKVGGGGKCGSTAIDRQFLAWMHGKFGKVLEKIPNEKKGAGSPVMNALELLKRKFKGDQDLPCRISFAALGRRLEADGVDSKYFDKDDGSLRFSGRDMAKFFEPTVRQTCDLIKHKSADVKKTTKRFPDISKSEVVILAGGLSLSSYLCREVRKSCTDSFGSETRIILPENPWSAISEGAVHYGMDRAVIINRVCRRWYCVVQERAFVEGMDSEDRAVMRPLMGKRVRGPLTVLLHKGEKINKDGEKRYKGKIIVDNTSDDALRYSYIIISSDADQQPEFEDDQGCNEVGQLRIDLRGTVQSWGRKGWWKGNFNASETPVPVKLNIVVSGGHGAGLVHVQANAQKKNVGEWLMNLNDKRKS